MRRLGRLLAAMVAVVPVAALAAPGLTPVAVATTPGVGFTADALPTYQINGIAWSAAAAKGVVYVGGTFSAVRPPGAAVGTQERAVRNVVGLDATTGKPTGCAPTFTGNGASVRALAVSPDKRVLYAAGRFSGIDGSAVSNLAAVDLGTCRPVPAFHPQVAGWVHGLAVAPNGTVYLAGEFRTVDGKERQRFAAVSPGAALLPWAPAADLAGYTVAVTPGGKRVVLGGAFDVVNGVDSHALAVVGPSIGTMVRSYPSDFVEQRSTVKSVAADDSGIYTGNEGTGAGVFDGRLALDAKTLDERWRDTCLGATQDVLVDRGRVYGADHAHNCTSMGGFPDGRRQHLTVEPTDDPHLKVWWPDTDDGLGEALGPRALSIATGAAHRYLFAVGEFTRVNGLPQQGVMRLADGPDTGAPSAPAGLSGSTSIARQVRLRWLASIDRDDENLTYRVYRGTAKSPVATLHADSDWWRRPQVSFVDSNLAPGKLYVYKVTATDSSGNVSAGPMQGVRPASVSSKYAASVLADRPSLFWRYDERSGSTLSDESPVGNGGILRGTRTPGVPGALRDDPSTALRLDGVDGYAYEAQPGAQDMGFTVETWFETKTKQGGRIVGFGTNTTKLSDSYDRQLYLRDDGRLAFGVYTTSASTLTTHASYNDGKWHHVVGTQGPRGMVLYVDGATVASASVRTVHTYLGYWRVGGDNLRNWPGRPSSDFFTGTVDETAVYPSQLTAARVAAHYRASGRSPSGAPTANGTGSAPASAEPRSP
jgi:Concanavalin A-like lectin/glucanases superfamily